MSESTLGEIIPDRLSSYTTKLKDINALYRLFYGEEGNPRKNRKDVRIFKGFQFNSDKEYEDKKIFIINNFTIEELEKICAWFRFEVTGSKEKLAERLCMRLVKLSQLSPDNESEDENDDEHAGVDNNNDDDDSDDRNGTEPTTKVDSNIGHDEESRRLLRNDGVSRQAHQSVPSRDKVDDDSRR